MATIGTASHPRAGSVGKTYHPGARHSTLWTHETPSCSGGVIWAAKRDIRPPISRSQLKALLEHTGTGQNHQYLIVCEAGARIHVVQAVQQADHLFLIEERD